MVPLPLLGRGPGVGRNAIGGLACGLTAGFALKYNGGADLRTGGAETNLCTDAAIGSGAARAQHSTTSAIGLNLITFPDSSALSACRPPGPRPRFSRLSGQVPTTKLNLIGGSFAVAVIQDVKRFELLQEIGVLFQILQITYSRASGRRHNCSRDALGVALPPKE